MFDTPEEVIVINGAQYRMPQWLDVGTSIFLPSVNHRMTYAAVREWAPWGWKLTWRERIEGGLLGIRVWRIG